MENTLQELVYQDIKHFISKEETRLFFNERDLQMHLAIYLLKSNKYDDVEVEYYIPVFNDKKEKILDEYLWNSEIRLDIVVRKGDEYLPLEIKYKTKKIDSLISIKRFGYKEKNVNVIKNQSAQDLGCYGFWKDVRRIEVVKNKYSSNVKGGIAIFLTNDSFYWNTNIKTDSAYFNFRLSTDNKTINKEWTRDVKVMKNHPNFKLDSEYSSEWINKRKFIDCRKEVFKCYIVRVFSPV